MERRHPSGHAIIPVVDTDHLVPTVVLAFSVDPFIRWMLPDARDFLEHFSSITRLHGIRTGPAGGAWAGVDGHSAAFWYPPGVRPDGAALGQVFAAAGSPSASRRCGRRSSLMSPMSLTGTFARSGSTRCCNAGVTVRRC